MNSLMFPVEEMSVVTEFKPSPPKNGYVAGTSSMSFAEYVYRVEDEQFDVKNHLSNFRATSADPERLFSFARLFKNYLQNRLSPANHCRNAFLSKNRYFFDLEV